MLDGQTTETPEAIDDTPPAAPATLSLTPEQVRSTPEFRALEKQNRTLARKAGAAEAAAAAARTDAETARQAAEAQATAALEQQLIAEIGPDGIAAYSEIAELAANDPVAAARRLAELVRQAQGQTPPATASAAVEQASEESGTVANASATPPPPNSGVDGGVPLGQASTGEDQAEIISGLTKNYTDVVARNQNPLTRNRVTMRDRASALISYLGVGYLKAGAKPKSNS